MLRLEIIKEIKRNISIYNKNTRLTVCGDLDALKLLDRKYISDILGMAASAAGCGYLDIVEYLLSTKSIDLIDRTITYSYLEILQWLNIRGLQDTSNTLGIVGCAAANGYLKIVQWLFANELECASYAVDYAAKNGYLEVVQWLYNND